MASLIPRSNGRFEVQYKDKNGNRPVIRLGRMSKRNAEAVKLRIEDLIDAHKTSTAWRPGVAEWVASLGDVLHDRIAAKGLVPARDKSTLGPFLNEYIGGRKDLKPRTLRKLSTTRDYLIDHFGADKPLRDITPGDADDWRIFLMAKGHAENTMRKHAQIVKQFFTAAQPKGKVPENPFAHLKSTVQPNPERFFFITRDAAEQVLNACPDAQWRLIFALCRFGGLRCTSEILELRWDDILWDRDRMVVRSPKTENHPGKASRIVPLFPELRPYLEDAHELAGDGEVFVITRYRCSETNLRTQFGRIVDRAGLERWPKLFQNLRSTRQTELEDAGFKTKTVCAWLGNSPKVAFNFYHQVTEEDYQKALQNALQGMPTNGNNAEQGQGDETQIVEECCDLVSIAPGEVAEEGLEPPTRGL